MKQLTQGTEYISNIKEARIRHGLTQKQVSEITGVPFRSIQNWEAGVRKCPDYVEKMIVNRINTVSDNVFLEVLLEILKADVDNVQHEETKEYIRNLIPTITKQVNK